MPKRTGKTVPLLTPKDFFINLLVFAALYTSTVSFLALVFAYVNALFPDNLGYYFNYAGEIIVPSSVLAVIFPIFLLTSWFLGKDLAKNPDKKEIKFRKWLVYLTLFAAAVTVIVDLIILLSNFYQGELTSRFIFKVMAVLLVALGIFWYYFLDLRKSSVLKPKLWMEIASLLVLAVLAGGFFIVGTPAQQRAKRFDERRVNDLQNIQSQLLNYWMQKEELPEELNVLAQDKLAGFILPRDPETNLNYPYHKLTAFSFEICADFKRPSADIEPQRVERLSSSLKRDLLPKSQGNFGSGTNWTHGKGETCFERTIDPEIYKKPAANP